VVGVAHEDDACAQAPLRRLAQCQLAQIDHRHRRAAVIEYAGHFPRRLRHLLDTDPPQDFGDLAGVQRVTVFSELKQEEENVGGRLSANEPSLARDTAAPPRYATSLKRETQLRKAVETWLSPLIDWVA